MSEEKKKGWLSHAFYHVVRWLVWVIYPKTRVEGAENLPDGPCIVVGNHAQMNGPIIAELYYPGKRLIWCNGEMMHLREVPAYAYQDFWSGKPKSVRWFFKLASYVIAPLSVCVFNNADTIGVYRDSRIVSTFRQTVAALKDGTSVIIFPECAEKRNNIVNQFQEHFVNVARLYYKQTGNALPFVPMYLAPRLKTVYIGEPVSFCPDNPIGAERRRICDALAERITAMAAALPRHTVVPYSNIPKKDYPVNTPVEEFTDHEDASC